MLRLIGPMFLMLRLIRPIPCKFLIYLLLSVVHWESCRPAKLVLRLLSAGLLTGSRRALPRPYPHPPRLRLSPAKICRTKVPRARAARPSARIITARRPVAAGWIRSQRPALRSELHVSSPPLRDWGISSPRTKTMSGWKRRLPAEDRRDPRPRGAGRGGGLAPPWQEGSSPHGG